MRLNKAVIIAASIALLTLPVGGCQGETSDELSPARLACIEMMQGVPVYYEDFEFWDVGALRDDTDLAEMYRVWYERKVEFLEENYGFDSARIDYLGQGEGLLDIIRADYDVGALREKIAAAFYRDTDYADSEVWLSQPSPDPEAVTGGWVLAEGLLVRSVNNSNVEDYLRVIGGEELSLYDKNAAALLEELPEGLMLRLARYPYPAGLVVSGIAVSKEDGETLKWTNVYKFESEEAARSDEADEYFDEIEAGFAEAESVMAERGESFTLRDFSLERDGEFVRWSVVVGVEYMIALLFYG
jgi:hypothetical protein